MRTSGDITNEFPIIIDLHQGLELSPYLLCWLWVSLLDLFKMKSLGVYFL
jgi:hypothetical protein